MSDRKSSRRKKIERSKDDGLEQIRAHKEQVASEAKHTVYPASSVSIHWEVLHTKRKVDPELKEMVADFYYGIQKNPGKQISELEKTVETYNDIQLFQDYLLTAYVIEEEKDKAVTLAENLKKRYPDFIIGKIAAVELALLKNDLNSIPAILGDKYEPTAIFPERAVFHIYEILHFQFAVGRYFALKGDVKKAEEYLNQIKASDEDHIFIKKLQKVIDKNSGLKFYQRVIKKIKG